MKYLWRSRSDVNNLDSYAQIVDVDGDKMLEVLIPRKPVFQRIFVALKYLFRGHPINLARILIDQDIEKIGGIYRDREDSEDK